MSRLSIILSTVIIVCLQFAFAQTIPEPVLDGRVVYVQEDGTGIFIEQQRAEEYGGHSNLEGFSSPIRLDRDGYHEFIIRADYSVDPLVYIRIFSLKHKAHHSHKRAHRYIHVPHHHIERIESFPYEYEKFGESSYRITLKERLIPGEYAITYGLDEDDVFNLFGVD